MKKLITTQTFYRDLSAAGAADWTVSVPIIHRCKGFVLTTLAANGTADTSLYFLWASIAPNGVLGTFLIDSVSQQKIEFVLPTETNIQSIQFKVAQDGLTSFVSTAATKIAFSISFYELD
jgi:hypothetical protein